MTFTAVERNNDIRIFTEIDGENLTITFVASYSDRFTTMDLAEFGEDYHDTDEVIVVGSFRDNTADMGWKSPEDLARSIACRSGAKTVRA